MMPAVPRGPGVGIATAGSRVGASGASIASEAGAGDGFGSALTAAMAKAAPRTHSAGQKSASSEHAAAGVSAHPGEAVSGPAQARAQAGGQKSTSKAMDAAAAERQAALAQARTAVEKHLPDQVSVEGTANGAGPEASKGGAKLADGTQGAAKAAVAGAGLPETPAKIGAAGGAAQAEIAKLAVGAGKNETHVVTEGAKKAASAAGTADPAQKDAAAGQPGSVSGQADGKALKPGEKKDTGPAAGKSEPVAQMAAPGLMAVAMAAQAAGTVQFAVPGAKSPGAAHDREVGGLAGRVAGKVLATMQGKMRAAGVSESAGAAATAGNAAGAHAAAAVAVNAMRTPGSLGVAAGDSGGKHAALDVGGSATGAEAAPAAGGGPGGVAGTRHGAPASLARTGKALESSQAAGADPKSGSKIGSKRGAGSGPGNAAGSPSSGRAASGFTASLLQGHPSTGVAGHSGAPHAAGGVGNANPYTRMDETQGHALVFASPQKMSVAVTDPSLGSFQVRAQNAGAQVAASLATASAATHAQLSGHLPSLTAFLQEQRVDVARVTMAPQSLLGGDAGPRDSGGHERQGRSGSRSGRRAGSGVRAVGASGALGAAERTASAIGAAQVSGAGVAGTEMESVASVSPGARTAEGARASVDLLA